MSEGFREEEAGRERAAVNTSQPWGQSFILPVLPDLNISATQCSPDLSSTVFSQANINGVYIPSVLLIVGVAIVKREWVPYAAAIAAIIGGYKIFASGRKCSRLI